MKAPSTAKHKPKPAHPAARDPAPWSIGPEIVRRCLLGFVTALIVARPLVQGEDPGLLIKLYSDASSQVLTFLWLSAAAAWALWRAWTGQRGWYAGAVEGGLAAVVGLTFLSAGFSAAYKHPAWLIAWEWLGMLVAFCLVRQMFRTAVEGQRLLAAILATGVSLGAYAVYQYTLELPEQRKRFSNDEAIRAALREQHLVQREGDDLDLESFRKRVEYDHVFGTFAHPNSFAGYLALLLPAAAGWAAVSWRQRGTPWLAASLTACALLVALALWLTHSRGAILGTLLVAVTLLAIRARTFLWQRKWLVAIGIALAAAAAFLAFQAVNTTGGVEKSQRSLGLRRDYWTATWKMITDTEHPRFLWLGVGPGSFGRHYPRYMRPTAFEDVKDPHNFALEVWATTGVFALIALIVALAAFFRATWPTLRDPLAAASSVEETGTRWEFYCGAMTGLLLAFVLWASGQTGEHKADAILLGGVAAGARSVVWFVAFALLERVAWSDATRALALAAGVAALLLNLTVSGGIGYPSVALLLWVMAALALNALPVQPPPRSPGLWFAPMLVAPLLACLALVYLAVILVPAVDCIGYLQGAREYYVPYREMMQAGANKKAPLADSDFGRARYYVDQRILPQLEKAVRADPNDATPHIELAHWYEQLWVFSRQDEHRKKALKEADSAIALDPESKEGYLARYELNILSAQQPVPAAKDFYRQAAADLTQVVKRDPTRARLRYQLAEVYFHAGDAVERRRQAREALDLDALSTEPSRKLTEKQRQQAQKWVLVSGE